LYLPVAVSSPLLTPTSGSIHPSPTPEQNLLRLRNHLDTLPTPLLKHVHLSKVRREDPNLFFAAMKDDLPGL
jgi:malate dehydrogenase (oxaloacetate-decarboxylating)(NADP+)